MTGISGFKGADFPTLPAGPGEVSTAPDTKACDLNVPGPIPDTDGMSSQEVYDLFAGYVEDYGSQEAKDALAAGQKVQLRVHAQGQPGIEWIVELDPVHGTGTVTPVTSNETVSKGGAGTNDPTCAVGTDGEPDPGRPIDGQWNPEDGANTPPAVPPFLAHLFKPAGD